MEIPYIVNARKDTGLNNSKIAIWLFLASEVMLFGGLFSSYIFLRIFADYPWPERALPVLPGLINTFILIASSVTVVFAWAALKLRKWKVFVFNMSFTLICAAVFMVFKFFEYKSKFDHQALQFNSFAMVEGHLDKKHKDPDTERLNLKNTIVANDEGSITYNVPLASVHFPYVEEILKSAEGGKFVITQNYYDAKAGAIVGPNGDILNAIFSHDGKLIQDEKLYSPVKIKDSEVFYLGSKFVGKEAGEAVPLVKKGTELSVKLLEKLKEYYINARTHNQEVMTDQVERAAWHQLRNAVQYSILIKELIEKGEDPKELSTFEQVQAAPNWNKPVKLKMLGKAKSHNEDVVKLRQLFLNAPASVSFELSSKDAVVALDADWGKMLPSSGFKDPETNNPQKQGAEAKFKLKDSTEILGKTGDNSISIHIDGLDFRHLVMKYEEKHKNLKYSKEDIYKLIEQDKVFQPRDPNSKGAQMLRDAWKAHKQWAKFHEENLGEGRVNTAVDDYRITWKQFVAYNRMKYNITKDNWQDVKGKNQPTMLEGFTGPDHYNEDFAKTFPNVVYDRDAIRFESVFSPKLNNYYAIYFTITGLHGLHVIGGAIVLGYYLFFGYGMYKRNPDWLANRVEVGGLFWHFVDLVWIFVFPIFYLM